MTSMSQPGQAQSYVESDSKDQVEIPDVDALELPDAIPLEKDLSGLTAVSETTCVQQVVPTHKDSEIDFPDGGFRAWLIVFGVRPLLSACNTISMLMAIPGCLRYVLFLWICQCLGGMSSSSLSQLVANYIIRFSKHITKRLYCLTSQHPQCKFRVLPFFGLLIVELSRAWIGSTQVWTK